MVVERLGLDVIPEESIVGMATKSLSKRIKGFCVVNFNLLGPEYIAVKLYILDHLCTDVILGTDFQQLHNSIIINYGGDKPSLTFCAVTAIKTNPAKPFTFLTEDCKPIATKSRKYSNADRQFIDSETKRLLEAGIIEPSCSPWRAQPLVVKEGKTGFSTGVRRQGGDKSEVVPPRRGGTAGGGQL